MSNAKKVREADPLAETMEVFIGAMDLPRAKQLSAHEVDPYAETMEIYIGEKRRGLRAILLEKANALLRRAGADEVLVQLLTIPSTATIAALIVSAIIRNFRS